MELHIAALIGYIVALSLFLTSLYYAWAPADYAHATYLLVLSHMVGAQADKNAEKAKRIDA